MNPIARSIAQARRRVLLQDMLTALGWLSLAALLLGTLLLLAARLLATPVPGWLYALPAAALLGAPLIAFLRRPDQATLATMIDHRLKLKDRLATALYAQSLPDDPFARRVVADAQSAAAGLRIKDGFGLRLERAWSFIPPAVALVALLALLLPQKDLLGFKARQALQQAQQALAQETQEQVSEAMAVVEQLRLNDPDRKESDASDQTLQELAELTRADLRDPEMRRNAAAKLSDVESKLSQSVEKKQQEFQTLQNALSQLETQTPGPADEFADALRRGDFEAARQSMEKLAQEAKGLSEADKKALAEQLKNLAQQLQQAAQQAAKQQQESQQQIAQALKDAGVPPQQAQQLQQQNLNPQAVQQALQQQGMSPQQARQMAQQLQQKQQQSQNAGQCSNQSQGLSSPLQQMAQSMSQSQSGSPPQQQQQQQMQQAAGQTSRQLQQMAQMQQQLQQMRQSQAQMQQAVDSMCRNPGSGKGEGTLAKPTGGKSNGQHAQGRKDQQPGVGGSKAGTAEGGNPLGAERQLGGYQTSAEGDIHQGEGKVVASWLENGPMVKGQPQIPFDQAITEARKEAEQAVTEDRVPKRYHEAIREYFDQVPQTADRIAPPPAPR